MPVNCPEELYRLKKKTAADAVELIVDGKPLALSMGVSQPPALMSALADRVRRGSMTHLPVYYMHGASHSVGNLFHPVCLDVVKPHSLFLSASDRRIQKAGLEQGKIWLQHVPCTFHQVGRLLTESVGCDSFMVTVSRMDRHGYMSLGTNCDYATELVRSAKQVIVEVNDTMPRVFGEALIHVSEVTALVENSVPVPEVLPTSPGTEDEIIAQHIVELIPDGATIQMGVGGVPNAVASYLKDHNDLGLHTELMVPGLMGLIKRGNITGREKTLHRLKHLFTLALGNRELYDFMDDNPSLAGYPASYINNPEVIAKNDRMISVNSALQIDLTGQINAEAIGGREYSGPGGQLDFVRGAFASREGKSFVALHSTARAGSISRIVPRLETAATDPRMDTHYVVTEHGIVNLKGLSISQRAEKLIGLAEPKFRDELRFQAIENGYIAS
ncbi:acetyl-CoA hydrolase/transferase family protein [Kiloniella sp. b19]|uniref:acetyl-CoA hydrolase/transferase family protein n=1 Tax=Kiloniella sp. GXU_MW_B19 TaxID=3141326 RepID=UPI0031E4309F